jgi:UDPglucose 6-dehydrogenase
LYPANGVQNGLVSADREPLNAFAYLGPGGAFAGGTLARDVVALTQLAASRGEPLALIPAIKLSNDRHKAWALSRLKDECSNITHSSLFKKILIKSDVGICIY